MKLFIICNRAILGLLFMLCTLQIGAQTQDQIKAMIRKRGGQPTRQTNNRPQQSRPTKVVSQSRGGQQQQQRGNSSRSNPQNDRNQNTDYNYDYSSYENYGQDPYSSSYNSYESSYDSYDTPQPQGKKPKGKKSNNNSSMPSRDFPSSSYDSYGDSYGDSFGSGATPRTDRNVYQPSAYDPSLDTDIGARTITAPTVSDAEFKVKKPFAKLSNDVKGWTCMSPWSPGWVGRANEIEAFDVFDSWEFGETTLMPANKTMLYLKKTFTRTGVPKDLEEFYKKNDVVYYVIDPTEFNRAMERVREGENLITVTVLEEAHYGELTPMKILTRDPRAGGAYTGRFTGTGGFGSRSENDLVTANRSDYPEVTRLAIKFYLNSGTDVVRFLIYPMVGRQVRLTDAFDNKDYAKKTFVTEEVNNLIQSNNLYSSFYYEASAKTFMKFMESPQGKFK